MSKHVVILGASQGIGAELVKYFSAQPDTIVTALSRNLMRMNLEFKQKNVNSYALDISKDVAIQIKAIQFVSPIDILINNAGFLIHKPFEMLTHEDFQLSYQTNVIGIMESTQALLPRLSTDAHIINISSMGGFQGSLKFAGLTAYSTSKAALCSFTELFAEEYKNTGLRMNCLCLGAVQTQMLSAAFPGYKAPTSAKQMAEFIANFALQAGKLMNGKIIAVSSSNP